MTKINPTGRFWLMKSEPDAYSWDDLLREGEGIWDGVRNYRARNNLRAMQVGDLAFFYHSNVGKEIVGTMRISVAGLADPGDETGTWASVKVKPIGPLKRRVTLAEIKADAGLAAIELLTQSRLSVSEVRPSEWEYILKLSER